MSNKTQSFEMSTQILEEVQVNDSRFWKVKIWLMHLGKNLNGTLFTRESVINAIPSLANTPIMAKIDENRWGEKDFRGHEIDVELTDEEDIRIFNATVPFGVIPESNNAQLEKRLCDDMVEREYLTVEGLLWSKWDGAIDVLLYKNGKTGQSMEITDVVYGDAIGGVLPIDSFKFFGACLLGDDVTPAMEGSTTELQFATNSIEFIKQKLNEYSLSVSEEGGNILPKDVKFEEEDVIVSEEEQEEGQLEGQEEQPPKQEEEGVVKEDKEEEAEEVEETPENPEAKDLVVVDPVSVDTIAEGRAADKVAREDLPQPKDLVVVRGQEFSVKDIEALLDKLATKEAEFAALKAEVKEEKVAELFAKHAADLDASDIEALKAKAGDLSVEELQTQIFAVLGQKRYEENKNKEANFSITPQGVKISVADIAPKNTIDDIMESFK